VFRLTMERQRRGLSQSALSRLSGVHPSVISQLEAGKVHPYSGWKRRLGEALGVPGDELFERVDDGQTT